MCSKYPERSAREGKELFTVKIHEYQAKQVLAQFGVPIPRGEVATSPYEAYEIASRLGGTVVVKAQIHAGGRGKGGGVKLASHAGRSRGNCRQDDRHDPGHPSDRAGRAARSGAF